MLYAPLILNEKTGWRSSLLSQTSFPRRADRLVASVNGVSFKSSGEVYTLAT
jgi:hypothetical protein